MRIYLIGYMGCGKSTLGRRLAKHLDVQFVDMDHYIEERNCKTIPQIFEEEGEAEFRSKERKALEELSEFTDIVIATGGGAPCFFDNIDLMNRTGKTIYMNINPAILADRLLTSKTERPLIKGKSREELVAFIDETLKKRNEFYTQAQYQITVPDVELEYIENLLGIHPGT
ncbi:shikimate kinase [Maribellus sp. YY47]|uniref:shikimate kinase n=1 Tax=Maribellus sp. YY47 TaxID=2929486 RepID=UPI00200065C0|nr:shikimate kinase [Maribellus sp. YY47]MCK3682711.1 shikimate kinase [Maribellus sp. YY47]